jgi:beta-lactamase class A
MPDHRGFRSRVTMKPISRRYTLGALAASPFLMRETPAQTRGEAAQKAFDAAERRSKSRLGVAALATGRRLLHRGDERFPMCSTFKLIAAAYVLRRVDTGAEQLDRRIHYERDKLVPYSPTTEKHAGTDGMTLVDICEAAVTLSDNTAGNLLFESFGGPPALTNFVRDLGDVVTRFDRTEPTLNDWRPGELRDTTTPAAMLDTLGKLLVGDVLSADSRRRLIDWMIACRTGVGKLRAGVPAGWRIGDKTGGAHGVANDFAILWPPGGGPILIAAFMAESTASSAAQDAALADVARAVVRS